MSVKFIFFFFSSRRRHTRCYRDWSSDVCSSDLRLWSLAALALAYSVVRLSEAYGLWHNRRSEERRVGKECRSRWSRYDSKKKTSMLSRSASRCFRDSKNNILCVSHDGG